MGIWVEGWGWGGGGAGGWRGGVGDIDGAAGHGVVHCGAAGEGECGEEEKEEEGAHERGEFHAKVQKAQRNMGWAGLVRGGVGGG